jgi:hypothetical protein
MESHQCRNLKLRSRHSQHWRWIFPRLAFDLSVPPALPLERAVLPLSLVSDLNNPILDPNHLEYHPQAFQARNAITAFVQVEEVPLQAMLEDLKYFRDDQ